MSEPFAPPSGPSEPSSAHDAVLEALIPADERVEHERRVAALVARNDLLSAACDVPRRAWDPTARTGRNALEAEQERPSSASSAETTGRGSVSA